jgi:hypothetical protein
MTDPGQWEFVLWKAIMNGAYVGEDDGEDDKSDEDCLKDVQTALANGARISGVIPAIFYYNNMSWADVDEGDSPLVVSISLNKPNIARLLLNAGAKARDAKEAEKLLYRCENTLDAETLACLFKCGALNKINNGIVISHMLNVAGTYASFTVDFLRVCLEAAIAAGADLSEVLNDERDSEGRTMLHLAVCSYDHANRCETCRVRKPRIRGGVERSKRAPVVQLLIEYGAKITLTDHRGHTPLDLAKLSSDPDPEVEDILTEEKIKIEKCEAFALGALGANSGSIMDMINPDVSRMISRAVRESVKNGISH